MKMDPDRRKSMIVRETRKLRSGVHGLPLDQARDRSMVLFAESMVSLVSSTSTGGAMSGLVSLMGQSFPKAAPAVYVRMDGSPAQAFSVLDPAGPGPDDARRVLGAQPFDLNTIPVAGQPPLPAQRTDFTVMDTPRARVVLSINAGNHDTVFQKWVNILTPAVNRLMDHEVLLHMAYRDGLTGLLNYRAFEEALNSEHDRAARYGTTFSVMMIDIDWFKSINDGYGHQMGDIVLRTLAGRIMECVRKSDRVFRYGGEEFVIILPHTGIRKAEKLAERIRYIVERTEFIAGLRITVSAGISEHCPGSSAGEILKLADRGLYLAKKRGRNRVEVVGAAV